MPQGAKVSGEKVRPSRSAETLQSEPVVQLCVSGTKNSANYHFAQYEDADGDVADEFLIEDATGALVVDLTVQRVG